MSSFESTKIVELGSTAFRQWKATDSHCQFLHGYQLKAKLWFSASTLDENNWVVDFGGLDSVKEALKSLFDHTTCVAADDPNLEFFREMADKKIIVLNVFNEGVGIEKFAEYVFNLVDTIIKSATNDRCRVSKVEVFEHAENSAIYKPQNSPSEAAGSVSITQEKLVGVLAELAASFPQNLTSPKVDTKSPPEDSKNPQEAIGHAIDERSTAAPLYSDRTKSLAEILST